MNKPLLAGIGVVVLAAAGAYFYLEPELAMSAESPANGKPAVVATVGAAPAASAAGGPPVSVTSVKAQQRDFEVQLDATGTVTSANSVDVRPQVSSMITKVLAREGQFVKAGELLFTLDTRTDETNVAKAQAQLARDQATLSDATRQLARSRDLMAQKFLSQAAVDTTLSQAEAQAAVVQADKVAIDAARVGLSYGRITAPSAGRVGAIAVFAGSSVVANTTTLLSITQLDPIFVSFNLPQRNVGDALENLRNGSGKVVARMPDAKAALNGKLQFVDSSVDAASGTVKVKAVFDNKQQALWPGAFVTVKMTVRTLADAVVVPLAAVVQSPRGRVVFVIESGNKAAARPVELLQATGTEAVVSGVRAGEQVIVDGRQNVRPGSTVIVRTTDGTPRAGGARSAASAAAAGASATGATGVGTHTTPAAPQP
jgi:RND family efflux transporter MFP subunit